ncbi:MULTISPECIES: PLP-dependent aminotransferase family protein [Mesorhizobium]|uniref:aminotransferase-like domain-containing protein n=1 Tax=Mesorhizobium TaxID=68287 RepID=UPI0007EDE211|nr:MULTISPECIES: PLP-dependent aminotransferase family protein [Mesorhizobium]MCA0016503.1 PLP-dependent aminotransferase family protein [Mesorhizobium sp. B294B1A1]MCA0021805.1 PLP-dependent aminotransferase family protein [Mesorhizobium sp. B264B1A]
MAADGSVGLFDILCRIWLKPGKTVLIEEPCYDRVVHLLRHYGANVIAIPMEADGPALEPLNAAARRGPVFMYTVPDFQNPTGTTWSSTKRQHLVDLARTHDFRIVEDSPYRFLRYKGAQEPSILDIGRDVTVQLNSFSKVIAPGLRAAYLIAPPHTISAAAKVAESTYVTPGNFALSVTGEWLRRGFLGDQLAALGHLYAPRLEAMVSALDEFMAGHRYVRPDGGVFVGVTLAHPVDAQRLRKEASNAGLDVADGDGFFVSKPSATFSRLPFSSMDEVTVRRGVEVLSALLGRISPSTKVEQVDPE